MAICTSAAIVRQRPQTTKPANPARPYDASRQPPWSAERGRDRHQAIGRGQDKPPIPAPRSIRMLSLAPQGGARAMMATGLLDELLTLKLSLRRVRLRLAELRRGCASRHRGLPLRKYRPDQPRVPAGTADGGGRWPEATLGQQARLAASESQAQSAIRRVQEIDPRWRPPASMSEGIEGALLSNQAAIRHSDARLRELSSRGIGEGPFARESIPARGPGRLRESEQREIDTIGALFGCHTCGSTEPGTRNGRFIGDHQIPSALNATGRSQRIFPHCWLCSLRQGGFVLGVRGR